MTEADAAAGEPTPLTKRQVIKQKQKDPQKNVWMIQNTAKIQDPERRDLAYRRAAGMESKNVEQPNYNNFCRALGSSDHKTRHAAVRTLQDYLRQRAAKHGVTELELKQISYAAWNTLYMADRVTVQEAVSKALVGIVINSLTGDLDEDEYAAAEFLRMKSAEEDEEMQEYDDNTEISEPDEEENEIDWEAKQLELIERESDEEEAEDAGVTEMEVEHPEEEVVDESAIPHCRGAHLASCFFRTFLHTIVKQWPSMDKYRVDKFYTCLRLLLAELFRYLKERGWNPGLIRMFNDDLWNEVYTTVPNGIRYHVIDIFLEELVQVGGDSITEAIFLDIVQPLLSLAQSGAGGDDTVHNRVMEQVVTKFLDSYSVFRQDDDAPVFSQVHVGSIAAFIFELASDEGTTNSVYRKNLYDEYKRYKKRIQQVGPEKDVSLDDSEDEQDNKHGTEVDVDEPIAEPDHPTVDAKEKRPGGSSGSSPVAEPPSTSDNGETKKKKKKRKKNKGKGVESVQAEVPERAPNAENEIVISIEEQRKFKAASKEATGSNLTEKKKRQAETQDSPHPDSLDAKRVKFGGKNRAKSYKASMKDLRSIESVSPKTTPEKGILLNKDSVIAVKKNQPKKKRGKRSKNTR